MFLNDYAKEAPAADRKEGYLEFSTGVKWRRRENYEVAMMHRSAQLRSQATITFGLEFVNSNSETASWVAIRMDPGF